MDHTYLRYECADSFGLLVAAASSKAPPSNSNLAFLPRQSSPIVLTTAGSSCLGVNLKTGQPVLKVSHREKLSGGIGSGKALNSDQIVCLDVSSSSSSPTGTTRIATGWVDGGVRIFDVSPTEAANGTFGLIHSLLEDSSNGDFVAREPLLLNGHSQSPVRSLSFDRNDLSRLASGGSDGTVIVWDIVAESGLFRLLGHRGGITDVVFVQIGGFDGLVSSSLDGLVKVWDLKSQYCTQTIANHHGEVWGAACFNFLANEQEERRCRMITGGSDGQVHVWSVQQPKRLADDLMIDEDKNEETESSLNKDDVCFYMGKLLPLPNVATSNEKVISVQHHISGRYVGVLHANSKNVDVYHVKSTKESQKKRQRRLKRRQEKSKKKNTSIEKKEKKRGILDDPESSEDENETNAETSMDPELLKASDEVEYVTTVRASNKVSGFAFVPNRDKGELVRVVCALSTNGLELHSIKRKKESSTSVVVHPQAERLIVMDMHGHPTGIRSVSLSSDDRLACTVSKGSTKIWNVDSRSCVLSLSPAIDSGGKSSSSSCYGLCSIFLPGNTHVAVGTREGHLLLMDIAGGDLVYCEEGAHDGAIWSIDVRPPGSPDGSISLVTGSADKSVKFWELEEQDDESESSRPMFVHTRTLQMTDDVIAVRYSHTFERSKLLVFVATLDSTIKVFFDDSLKLFLSLYGHKLPVLAMDSSDDDMILASSGADKTVKIFGLDFGDTHRTMHGHEDSVTDLRFVKRTHNFFTTSKDGTVRYWDGDRFQQILILSGHFGEVNALAISRTGAFVLSGGMDRQIRVWERTKDIVFLEEERERELEKMFDKVNRDEGTTTAILSKKRGDDDNDDDEDSDMGNEPQSEEAVKRSVLSVSSGDRIMEALERSDQELKEIAHFRQINPGKTRSPSPFMLNMEPANYMLWVLKSVKSAELEQSLLVLPIRYLERLLYYLIVLLRSDRGVELCSKIAIFMVKSHQNQIIANKNLATPLRELRRLIRLRLGESLDMIGYDIAALKMVARVSNERKLAMTPIEHQPVDVWAGLGLGSDVAAALQSRGQKR